MYSTASEHLVLPPPVLVEQAVYGSGRSASQRGYHLLAKSAGISSETVTLLNRWCPSHGALAHSSVNASSLNFHPVGNDLYAISRTVYGEPEFSNRGGLQVATLILVLTKAQLERYDNNPFAVARMARAAGLLRWSPTLTKGVDVVELQPAASEKLPAEPEKTAGLLKALKAVLSGEPVVLTSARPTPEWLESLFLQVRPSQRLGLSFTTGLKPSSHRPFRIHLLDEVAVRSLRLVSQNLPVVSIAHS